MIYTRDLTKIYGGGVVALDRVSIRTPGRGIVSFIGPNGAGKTTLMRIIAGVLRPTSGHVEVAGIDVVREPERVREIVAFMPQGSLPPGFSTPYQFVLYYLMYRGLSYREARRRALETLELMGLGDLVDKKCSDLSYGTRQRVVASAVLASDAEIVVLDEPTSGLDPVARRRLWSSIVSMGRGRLVLVTSHNPEEIETVSDYVVVMNRGSVVAAGRPRDLVEERGLRRVLEIYGDSIDGLERSVLEAETVVRLRGLVVAYYRDEGPIETLVARLSRDGLRVRVRPFTVTDLLILGGVDVEDYEET